MVGNLFVCLLLAHVLSDFFLQIPKMLVSKQKHGIKGYALYIHSAIVALLSWLFVWHYAFWAMALIIFVSHAFVDWIKIKFKQYRPWAFIVDQLIHIGILLVISIWFCQKNGWGTIFYEFDFINWRVILAAVIVLSLTLPANFLIQEMLWYQDNDNLWRHSADSMPIFTKERETYAKDDSVPRLKHAGAWIGCLERLLTFLFVLLGNYQAVGFIIAAKSILRFKESDGVRSEYVLVGTLLSVSMAIAAALIVVKVLWRKGA